MRNYWNQFDETSEMFWFGVVEGIKAFAHWKDGVRYVGTTGRTLEDALRDVEKRQHEMAKARARKAIDDAENPIGKEDYWGGNENSK